MRQRKVKNVEERLAEYDAYLAQNPLLSKGKWNEVFSNSNEIYIEVGCGKGKFSITLAEQNPDKNYIAIEGRESIILRALEKANKKGLKNIIFLSDYIKDIEDYFGQGELSGIYLNFSDPWPKDRHAKRRLTHSRYIDGYKNILELGHSIEFKTDNDGLFAFALEEFQKSNMELLECTDDLHSSDFTAKNVTTEYEDKFSEAGKKINYCKVTVKAE